MLFPKSEADIFAPKVIQNTIESSDVVVYRPVTSGLDECIEFLVPESPYYTDLSLTKLHLKVRILDPAGKPVINPLKAGLTAADPKVRDGIHAYPINNFMGSLFSQVLVYLNHKCITSPGTNHAYRSYIEFLLNYGSDSKSTHLQSAMYIEDDVGKAGQVDGNRGLIKRANRMSDTGTLEMMGYLHIDLANSNKLLLNNINLRLKLFRNKTAFSLLTTEAVTGDYKIEITDAALLVRRVKLNPSMIRANEIFLKKNNARYSIERNEIKTFNIAKDTTSKVLDNCFISQMPKRILMFAVDESAEFNYQKTPYFFKNHDLTYAHLSGDNFTNLRPITLNHAKKEYMEAYISLYDTANTFFQDSSFAILPDEFLLSSFIIGWDLSADSFASSNHLSMQKSGVLRLELQWGTPLKKNIKLMLYAEYDSFISIDSERNVYTDYAC